MIPETHRQTPVSYTVILRLLVAADGSVSHASVQQSGSPPDPALDEAALTAARGFRFDPARKDDAPTAAWILHEFAVQWTPEENVGTPPTPETVPPPAPTEAAIPETIPPEPPPDATSPANEPGAPVHVVVQGRKSGQRLQESARAVDVVDTAEARQRSADLGEVLARQHGVAVRRVGGLGSRTMISLNGLQGDQVRLFVDGVPAELAGYPLGIANLPVGFVQRAEIYRGVLPIAYGSDALGGAINVVTTDGKRTSRHSASYQGGSFDTHRLSGVSQYAAPSGWFTRGNAFFDTTKNDYLVEGEVFDDSGRLSRAEVRRFHDGYRAAGAGLELGVQDQPWARELTLRGYYTQHDKELQHNALMTVPYGEVTYGRRTAGSHVKLRKSFAPFYLDSTSGYTWLDTRFVDVSECRYDWYGRCVEIPLSGEIDPLPVDLDTTRHVAFSRSILSWVPGGPHQLRVAVAPTLATQSGRNRRIDDGEYDPATAKRTQFSLVSGLEWELRAWDDQFQNIAFVKDYLLISDTKEELPNGNLRDLSKTRHRLGAGDSLRQWLTSWAYVKASYEWATRLPNPEEMFGNGALVLDNLHIVPEDSHNLNLGWFSEVPTRSAGTFSNEVNGFGRWSNNQIVLLSNGAYFQHENVLASRALGVEAGARWTSTKDMFSLGGNLTWQDVRNRSSAGPFAHVSGDRIPNRPYLFSSGDARVSIPSLASASDALSFIWNARYTHSFFRAWESLGDEDEKSEIPSQLIHDVAAVYIAESAGAQISASIDISNITNVRAYDYWGVQRPGRAVAFKLALSAPGEETQQ